MYIPNQFEENRLDILHELIQAKPLATLITQGAHGTEANYIPMVLSAKPLPFGSLSGHAAKTNPFWREHPADTDVLVIFHGAESYISPAWLAAKGETGKTIHIWNFVTVHVKGKLKVINDPAWIRSRFEVLTDHNESNFEHPWAFSDVPEEVANRMLAETVGLEILITDIRGNWKVSQDLAACDREIVAKGLTSCCQWEMAELVRGYYHA